MVISLILGLAAAMLIGVLIGAMAIGGVLLPPVLIYAFGMSVRDAMATSLITFIFTGLLGAYFFKKSGSLDLRSGIILSLGSLPGGPIGVRANLALGEHELKLLLSLFLLFAGVYILARSRFKLSAEEKRKSTPLLLLLVGFAIGVAAGLTGIGGPLVSVPALIILKFPTLVAVGTSQFNSFFASLSGTAGNMLYNSSINYSVAALVGSAEILGVIIGTKVAHRIGGERLRTLLALTCIALGAWMIFR